jgi:hypothetical protein
MPYPVYSPDLAPWEFFLCASIKRKLTEDNIPDRQSLKSAITHIFDANRTRNPHSCLRNMDQHTRVGVAFPDVNDYVHEQGTTAFITHGDPSTANTGDCRVRMGQSTRPDDHMVSDESGPDLAALRHPVRQCNRPRRMDGLWLTIALQPHPPAVPLKRQCGRDLFRLDAEIKDPSTGPDAYCVSEREIVVLQTLTATSCSGRYPADCTFNPWFEIMKSKIKGYKSLKQGKRVAD